MPSTLVRILFIGDVVGDAGMKIVEEQLPILQQQYSVDCMIVNGENIWNGKGLSEADATKLFSLGVDCITTGNHIWENWKSKPLLASNLPVLRPLNYPSGNTGKGFCTVTTKSGHTIGVLQLQGRIYMSPIDCPFKAADFAVPKLRNTTKVVIVDLHAEATAEKIAFGHYLDGSVSAILGTHTHVQTADDQILPKGTGYITDVGMTGPYDSVLGLKTDIALQRMLLQTAHKYESAEGNPKVCGVFLIVDTETGKTTHIERIMTPSLVRTIEQTTN
jgi:metallophosphoesterase (TIGR00282 family)